jgi:putative ATP-binding cassette transporter
VKLFWILLRSSRGAAALAVLAGAVSGVSGAGLIAIINAALNGDSAWSRQELAGAFLALFFAVPLSRQLSDYLLVRLGQQAVYDLRMKLSRRILATPLRRLEEVGNHRLLVALTDDVNAVTAAFSDLPALFVNLALLLGATVYIGWLSPGLLGAFVVLMALGIVTYRKVMKGAMQRFRRAREEQDDLYDHFRGLTEGAKELKLHDRRRASFLGLLEGTARSQLRLHVAARSIFSAAGNWGTSLFFVIIGVAIFVLPQMQPIAAPKLSGFILALLYIRGPLQVFLNALPQIGRGSIAMKKVEQLGLDLTADSGEADREPAPEPRRWRLLEWKGVSHAYRGDVEESSFTLGPLDFTLRPGEVVFLVGGNGSGKTTFAKVLTGLYTPEGGEVYLDGERVTGEGLDGYRKHFAAIFSDFYLFERLLGLERPELDAQARQYLDQLQLAHKVSVRGGALSTTDLSRGQRKRLALLTAYLEDRPIYVFDEWAADQDPHFKEVFYCELLPELKARGKAVVVISHDDRYFGVADRILKLEYGQLVEPAGAAPAGLLSRLSEK